MEKIHGIGDQTRAGADFSFGRNAYVVLLQNGSWEGCKSSGR
jgi:hypothetical protein